MFTCLYDKYVSVLVVLINSDQRLCTSKECTTVLRAHNISIHVVHTTRLSQMNVCAYYIYIGWNAL